MCLRDTHARCAKSAFIELLKRLDDYEDDGISYAHRLYAVIRRLNKHYPEDRKLWVTLIAGINAAVAHDTLGVTATKLTMNRA